MSVDKLFKENNHLCNISMNQNYDTEIYNMVANKNDKSLNCSVPFHPRTKSNVTGKFIEICKTSILGEKAYANMKDTFNSWPQIPKYKPCAWMDVSLGLPHISHDQTKDEAFLRLYFKSHFKIKNIISYYDFTSLVADLGGYIGMLLGISLIDLTLKFNNLLVRVLAAKFKPTYNNHE